MHTKPACLRKIINNEALCVDGLPFGKVGMGQVPNDEVCDATGDEQNYYSLLHKFENRNNES